MKSSVFGSATWKRFLGVACVALSVAMCGGGDDDGGSKGGGSGGESGGSGKGGSGKGGSGGSGGSGAAGPGGEGGAGGQGGSGVAASLSGVVAGYVRGATVFLDLDVDFTLDANEPSARTHSDGSFELELEAGLEPANFPVVAVVPAGAIDSVTGEGVRNGYVLAAPAGANTFVSPLSSLVAGLVERYPGFSLEEAEASIRSKLAVGDDVSLFADYVADAASSSATAAESQKLERVSRVLATAFGLDQRAIDASTTTTAEPVDAFTLVTHNAELTLASVASAVETELEEDELQTIAVFLKRVDVPSLEDRLDRSRRATRADFFDAFSDGVYIPFPGPNGAVFGYARIRPTPADRAQFSLPQQDYSYDIDTETYVAEPPIFDAGYNLTADGWTPRTESNSIPTFSSRADGSADQTSELLRSAQRGTINAVDLSGRLLRSYAKGIDFTDRDARFPRGAVGYRMAVNTRSDEYLAFEEDFDNPELFDLTTLDEVLTAYGRTGVFLRTASALNVRLDNGGIVRFSSGREEMSLPLTGSWRRRTVAGAELVEINVPVAYKTEFDFLDATSDLFVAVVDGHARTGAVTRAGIADLQDYYLLNRAAFDAVLAGAVAIDDGVPVFGQVAAEGYIEGATVFLDLDDDGVLDAGEPSETTNTSGEYALFWSARDVEAHSIAVSVPATASVRLPDVGQSFSVTQPFSLRAPPGETFITPYTTLAWYVLQTQPSVTYDEALASLATTVGATGSLADYVDATDSLQTKLRLVAGMVGEKLKEARARMLSNATGGATIVLNPDDIAIYRSIVGATYETLAGTVTSVEAMLSTPTAPADDLKDFVDKDAWSEIAGDLFYEILSILADVAREVIQKMITVFVAELAGEIAGHVPLIGWALGPAVKCSILEANGLECG